jgi:hypothetical protein
MSDIIGAIGLFVIGVFLAALGSGDDGNKSKLSDNCTVVKTTKGTLIYDMD